MAILNRVTRLFRADLHAILDSIEDPESLLKQAIREMEEILDEKRARLNRVGRSVESVQDTIEQLNRKLQLIGSDLKVALAEGAGDLGRRTVARKISTEKQIAGYRMKLQELERTLRDLSTEIDTQQEQYESIVEKAELFVQVSDDESPSAVAEAVLNQRRGAGCTASEEEVELEWMRLQSQGGQS